MIPEINIVLFCRTGQCTRIRKSHNLTLRGEDNDGEDNDGEDNNGEDSDGEDDDGEDDGEQKRMKSD